jgi:AbiU2
MQITLLAVAVRIITAIRGRARAEGEEVTAVLVEEIARDGFLCALEILQLVEVMEMQNRGRINGNLSDSGAARAGIVVRNSLIARITLLVAGAFSPVRQGDRHLRQAFECLKDPQTRATIEKQGSAKILQEASDLWDELNIDPLLRTIKHFRNKYTAHSAEPNANIPIPSFTDFFGFAKKAASLMEKLAHAVGGTTERLDDTAGERIASAQAFWEPWEFQR